MSRQVPDDWEFSKYFEDGIYDDGPNYFNYNIVVPQNAPDDLRGVIAQMGQFLKEGRTIEFMGLLDQVDCLTRWSHDAKMITRDEAQEIFRILGWKYYG